MAPERRRFEYGKITKDRFDMIYFWKTVLSKIDIYGIEFTVLDVKTEEIEMYADYYVYITQLKLFTNNYPIENTQELKDEQINTVHSRMGKSDIDIHVKKRLNQVFFNRIILDANFQNEARLCITPSWFIKIERLSS